VVFSQSPSESATPPKVGAICIKAGNIKNFQGKKYTCIKSGKNLVWNKGVVVSKKKPALTPTPTPTPTAPETSPPTPAATPTPTPMKDLSSHESITLSSKLSDLSVCKTADLTNQSRGSNGFPRPASAKTGKTNIRILFLPISFTDFPFQMRDLNLNKQVATEVQLFYSETSYGNVSLTFDFLEKEYWVEMGRSAASYNLIENKPQQNNTQVVEDALRLADASINFNLYDGVIVESTRFQSTGGGQGFPGETFRTKSGLAKGVSLEFGTAVANFNTIAHELGHSLFSLEDLYVFLNANRPSVPDPTPAGSWDMMSNSSREFFGWNKLLNGWLLPNQVRCVTSQDSTVHYLENIQFTSEKPKLTLINLQLGVTIAIETRSDFSDLGVLVYKIDSRIPHGEGPITAQKTLLRAGKSLSMDGWRIEVQDVDSMGALVKVSRG